MQTLFPKLKVLFETGFFISTAIAALLIPLDWLLAWLTAAAVHELGHCICIHCCHGTIQEVRLSWNGAIIKTDVPPRYEAVCAFFGPAMGALLILFYRWLPRVAISSFAQTLVNMLPLYPMDGGRVLRGISRRFFSKQLTDRIMWLSAVFTALGVSYVLCRFRMWNLVPLLGVILLLKGRNIKIPCKPLKLRVQ